MHTRSHTTFPPDLWHPCCSLVFAVPSFCQLERFFAGQQLQESSGGAGASSVGASDDAVKPTGGAHHHPSASTGPTASVASIVAHAFASIPLFRSLTKTEQAVVASSLQCEKYMGGDVVLDGTKDGGPALVIGEGGATCAVVPLSRLFQRPW